MAFDESAEVSATARRDYRFFKSSYEQLCDYAGKGEKSEMIGLIEKLPRTDKSKFGPSTFNPPLRHKLKSPLLIACMKGNLHIVQYFLEKHKKVIDVNAHYYYGLKVGVTLLMAACHSNCNSPNGIPKYLLSKGADVNAIDTSGNTALHYSYEIETAKFLVENGARIDQLNHAGQSPLLLIASSYQGSMLKRALKTIKYLLDKGARPEVCGYSVLHCANDNKILNFLFEYGLSKLYLPDLANNMVSAPLYVHACIKGKSAFVEKFLQDYDCPVEVKANAYFLMGTYDHEMWIEALRLVKKHEIPFPDLPPVAEYGGRVEVKTEKELDKIWLNQTEVAYQRLLIQERCLGRPTVQLVLSTSWISNIIIDRAIKLELAHCQQLLSQSPGSFSSLATKATQEFLSKVSSSNPLIIECGLALLKCLHDHAPLAEIQDAINVALQLFIPFVNKSSIHSSIPPLAEEFVSEYLHFPPGSNLLCANSDLLMDNPALLELILQSGGSAVINDIVVGSLQLSDVSKHTNERTFLHQFLSRVFLLSKDWRKPHQSKHTKTLKVLNDYGFHLETTNSEGTTIFADDMNHLLSDLGFSCTKARTRMQSLSCLAANTIVKHNIPYKEQLPPRIAHLVHIHDPSYFKSLDYF